jgi:hypothetical protein
MLLILRYVELNILTRKTRVNSKHFQVFKLKGSAYKYRITAAVEHYRGGQPVPRAQSY